MNYKITLRASEVLPFMNFISGLFERSRNGLDVTEFYNLRKFCKQLFDKHYRLYGSKKKNITMNVDVNLLDSMQRLRNLNSRHLKNPEFSLCFVLLNAVIAEMLVQKERIPVRKVLPFY